MISPEKVEKSLKLKNIGHSSSSSDSYETVSEHTVKEEEKKEEEDNSDDYETISEEDIKIVNISNNYVRGGVL